MTPLVLQHPLQLLAAIWLLSIVLFTATVLIRAGLKHLRWFNSIWDEDEEEAIAGWGISGLFAVILISIITFLLCL